MNWNRTIILKRTSYIRALWFSLRLWYYKKPGNIEFSTGTRRDIGRYLTNVILGKLGETAFVKFLSENGVNSSANFRITNKMKDGKKGDIKFRSTSNKKFNTIDVVTSRRTSKYLIVGERNFRLDNCGAYVLVYVDLPTDHLFKIIATPLPLPNYITKMIGSLDSIKTHIVGFAWNSEIQKSDLLKKGMWLRDPKNHDRKLTVMNSNSYIIPVTDLHSSNKDWEQLVKKSNPP